MGIFQNNYIKSINLKELLIYKILNFLAKKNNDIAK